MLMRKYILSFAILCSLGTSSFAQSVTPETQMLINRNSEFRKDIIKLADNVYTAVGYDASNVTMIIGTDGIVLIDAGKIPELTKDIYTEFRKITDKPITGIIFTHGHGDHTRGVTSFLKDGQKPRVWAAEGFYMENSFPAAAGFKNPRSYRQQGMRLRPEQRINNGVAPVVYPGGKYKSNFTDEEVAVYTPFDKSIVTDYVKEPKRTITVSGITLELTRTYGETSDHLVVWYPDKRIVFPGDQYYKSFPNLYAIRGTAYRDVNRWIDALDTIMSYDADIMAQGHTRPIIGKEKVRKALTNYREAISFVFNKTIEGMNKGMTPDELVEYVKLPEHLKSDPDLVEYYGRVEWAVRNIHNGYLGWFDGNPTSLSPLSPKEEAERFVKIAGGIEKVEAAAKTAIKEGDYQWAAELSDRLLAIAPDNKEYRLIKADALTALGERTVTATGRNYYYTVANELRE